MASLSKTLLPLCASLTLSCTTGFGVPYVDTETGSGSGGSGGETGLVMVDGGNQFGECTGACRFAVTFQPSALQLVVSDYGASQDIAVNYGSLTDAGQVALAALDDELASSTLQDIYGCPDCDDGGASWLRLSRVGSTTDHQYETGNPPPELVQYDAFLQDVLVALRTCADSANVIPDADCELVP